MKSNFSELRKTSHYCAVRPVESTHSPWVDSWVDSQVDSWSKIGLSILWKSLRHRLMKPWVDHWVDSWVDSQWSLKSKVLLFSCNCDSWTLSRPLSRLMAWTSCVPAETFCAAPCAILSHSEGRLTISLSRLKPWNTSKMCQNWIQTPFLFKNY